MSPLPSLSTPLLRAVVRRQPVSAEPEVTRCELCGEPIDDDHRHLFDLVEEALLCACRACQVLFDDQAAGGRHYRLVPRRRVELADLRLDPMLLSGLGIPVELVFLVRDSRANQIIARYPSPAGALRTVVPAEDWRRLVAANPLLETQQPDVEALVVNRARGASEHWLLPVDQCFRLTGILRAYWVGFSGGAEVWDQITAFFDELKEAQ